MVTRMKTMYLLDVLKLETNDRAPFKTLNNILKGEHKVEQKKWFLGLVQPVR